MLVKEKVWGPDQGGKRTLVPVTNGREGGLDISRVLCNHSWGSDQ